MNRVVELCGAGIALALAVLPSAYGSPPVEESRDACSGPNPAIVEVTVVAERWVDEAGLLRIAGLVQPILWYPQRDEEVRARLMETEVFRSVDMEMHPAASGCALVLTLAHRPTVAEVRIEGARRPRLEVVSALWRWITLNERKDVLPTERDVYRLVPLRPGSFYDQDLLDRGVQRIIARYNAAGNYGANVSTRVVQRKSYAEIELQVAPGPPMLVTSVEVVTADAEARAATQEVLETYLEQPRVKRLERNVRRAVVSGLRRRGYFDARVDVDWSAEGPASGSMIAKVDAGTKQVIEIAGNDSVGADGLIDYERLYERVVLTENTWRQLAVSMRTEYQRRGYYEASVELQPLTDARISYVVEEGRRYSVGHVEFQGNRSLSDGTLSEVVETGVAPWSSAFLFARADDDTVAQDADRIRDLYDRRGFESTEVEPQVVVDRERGRVDVTFIVEEGPPTLVRSISVNVAEGRTLPEQIGGAEVGTRLDLAALQQEQKRLVSSLQKKGFLDAQATFAVQREAPAETVDAHIEWSVEVGPLHRIEEIVVEDNSETQYVVVERDLPFAVGDIVNPPVLVGAQQDVQASGVFRNVSIFPVQLEASAAQSDAGDGTDEHVDDETASAAEEDSDTDQGGADEVGRKVAVRVSARPPGQVSYGVGYDTLQGLTAFTELRFANFNRRAQKVRMRGQVGFEPESGKGPTQYLATAGFVEPRLLDGLWEWHVNARAERTTRTVEEYAVERFSIATGAGRELTDGFRFGADVQVEYANVFDVEPVPFRARDEANTWNTAMSPFLIYDGRDSAFNPTSGFLDSLRLRYTIPGISDDDLFEIIAQHSQVIPLPWGWGVAYSLRVGWVRSLAGDPIVPIRQRYFVGGGESVRGFAVNSLGPYDGAGNEVGGDLAIVSKTELRIPLLWGLGLLLFVDGGGNYLVRCDSDCRAGDPSDPDTRIRDAGATFDNYRWSAGAGLRYVTPIGPISVDYGFKLDRRTRELSEGRTDRESLGAFSINVGARF